MRKIAKGETGRMGENEAARFLSGRGYRILSRNYHSRYGEIDIIAENGSYLVFAEVKTRAKGSMLLPREAVDAKKQSRIIMTAQMYISCHDIGKLQPRFDVIEVTTGSNSEIKEINNIENAFTL